MTTKLVSTKIDRCEFETRPYVSSIVLELRDETFHMAMARVMSLVELAGAEVMPKVNTTIVRCHRCNKESVWAAPDGQSTAHVTCLYCKEPMDIRWDVP